MIYILQGGVEGYTEFYKLTRICIRENSTSKMNLVSLSYILFSDARVHCSKRAWSKLEVFLIIEDNVHHIEPLKDIIFTMRLHFVVWRWLFRRNRNR